MKIFKESSNVSIIEATKPVYGHFVGHGVGLLVHEGRPDRKFQENDIVAIEPGIYLFYDKLKDKSWINNTELNKFLEGKKGLGVRVEYTLSVKA